MKYVVQLSRIVESGVENWTESFDTLPEAEARITECNMAGSDILADPVVIEDREGPTG
jgi:hypothetical protein